MLTIAVARASYSHADTGGSDDHNTSLSLEAAHIGPPPRYGNLTHMLNR
jgi:hypothetical protein